MSRGTEGIYFSWKKQTSKVHVRQLKDLNTLHTCTRCKLIKARFVAPYFPRMVVEVNFHMLIIIIK